MYTKWAPVSQIYKQNIPISKLLSHTEVKIQVYSTSVCIYIYMVSIYSQMTHSKHLPTAFAAYDKFNDFMWVGTHFFSQRLLK